MDRVHHLPNILKFSATMVFSRFFNHPDQVEPYAYFYPEGIKNGNAISMNISCVDKIYDTQNQEALHVTFSVPKEHVSKIRLQSEAVFALRLKVDESQKLFFPYPIKGKQRYLGAKIRLKSISAGLYITDLNQIEDIVFAPLSDIKTSKAW